MLYLCIELLCVSISIFWYFILSHHSMYLMNLTTSHLANSDNSVLSGYYLWHQIVLGTRRPHSGDDNQKLC